MAITRNIVRMMGGDISVKSTYGVGSRFTVNMYLKLQSEEEINYGSFADLRVLVADDDPLSCESTCELLNDIGMNSEWVLTGKAAVDRVRTRQEQGRDFFAILVDCKMPDQGGVETTRQIRRLLGEDVAIIIISAYDLTEIEQEARSAGADAFLAKPLFRTKLVQLFNSIVGSRNGKSDADEPLKELEDLDLSGHRVLLAEDQEINAEIAMDFLEMTGCDVEWAKDGAEAVKMLEESPDGYYSLLLTDIRMPVMDGYEATKKIRAASRPYVRDIPIVAMSANAFAEDVMSSKRAGMNDHIAKPIDIEALVKVLDTYVRDRQ
jgi:CheY-like chemotaxis protein